jgi:hypothetical protein
MTLHRVLSLVIWLTKTASLCLCAVALVASDRIADVIP